MYFVKNYMPNVEPAALSSTFPDMFYYIVNISLLRPRSWRPFLTWVILTRCPIEFLALTSKGLQDLALKCYLWRTIVDKRCAGTGAGRNQYSSLTSTGLCSFTPAEDLALTMKRVINHAPHQPSARTCAFCEEDFRPSHG